jgi:hypothetical protein
MVLWRGKTPVEVLAAFNRLSAASVANTFPEEP